MYDIAIVGGGPAGLTAAIYALRAGKRTVLFEGNKPGGKLNEISDLENYPGFRGRGEELASIMTAQAMRLGLELVPKFVTAVYKENEVFYLTAGKTTVEAKEAIYCGGFARKTYAFAEKYLGSGVSYCAVCDGNFFRGRPVAVVGKGEAAVEDALYLAGICSKVFLVGEAVPALKDNVQIVPGRLTAIGGDGQVENIEVTTGEGTQSIEVDAVFLAMGAKAESILPFIEADGFIRVSDSATEIDGLYAAGDIVSGTLKQAVVACGSGATAAQKAIARLNAIKS